jgi:pimeloyl-ACP methyl ester carboxylesterase
MSSDGTRIAYWRGGSGPPLVLVHGATANHLRFRTIQPLLEEHFTVYAIDRRGRGESGDAPEYAIEREFEDLATVVDSLDEPASLLGHSYGATCALGAARLASNLRKMVLYEPAPGIPTAPASVIERMEEQIRRGEREQALTTMFRDFIASSEEEFEVIKASPMWPMRVAAAHTIPREARAEEEYRLDAAQFQRVTTPSLLLLGSESPEWARLGAERVCAVLPDARIVVLPGQGHVAIDTAPELFVSEVVRFLAE